MVKRLRKISLEKVKELREKSKKKRHPFLIGLAAVGTAASLWFSANAFPTLTETLLNSHPNKIYKQGKHRVVVKLTLEELKEMVSSSMETLEKTILPEAKAEEINKEAVKKLIETDPMFKDLPRITPEYLEKVEKDTEEKVKNGTYFGSFRYNTNYGTLEEYSKNGIRVYFEGNKDNPIYLIEVWARIIKKATNNDPKDIDKKFPKHLLITVIKNGKEAFFLIDLTPLDKMYRKITKAATGKEKELKYVKLIVTEEDGEYYFGVCAIDKPGQKASDFAKEYGIAPIFTIRYVPYKNKKEVEHLEFLVSKK